jgi:small GTP-binding protein
MQLDGNTLKFEIWDTAGQERYNSLAPMYYRGAAAALVVYDISKADSFERAKRWVSELHRNASANIVIALVGNKSDLGADREVEKSAAEDYAQESHLLFTEASARTGEGVATVFELVAQKLPKTGEHLSAPRRGASESSRSLNLGATRESKGPLDRCCQ